MKAGSTRALGALLLGLTAAGLATAGPPTGQEAERQSEVVGRMKKEVAAEGTTAGKLAVLARLMKDEPTVAVRQVALEAATQFPGPELDRFLTDALTGDADAGIRSRAATALGRLGSEGCLPALARAAGADKTTDIQVGCLRGRSSARRAATFAIADLAIRHPKLADDAAAKLRALKPVADPKDGEQLADARTQALYQITRDETLVKPFYDRLRSPDAKVRTSGVVAFRFLKLKAVPPELVAAQKDGDDEVRSWAALVAEEIKNPRPPRQ